jgi:hypothetical protein
MNNKRKMKKKKEIHTMYGLGTHGIKLGISSRKISGNP